jgi:UDP-4-amino-4,6-dideoxy-N-acetyl-beta-L-altrosamine N-acetyltransferase
VNESSVRLRHICDDDIPRLFEWVNNRELRVQSSSFHPVSWAEHTTWIEEISNDPQRQLLIISYGPDERAIGQIVFSDISIVHRNCNLSIRIGSDAHRNRGLGTQAISIALEYCWTELNLHRVALTVLSHNLRAQHVYEKCGFQFEGVMRDAAFIEGQWQNLVMMAILNPLVK